MYLLIAQPMFYIMKPTRSTRFFRPRMLPSLAPPKRKAASGAQFFGTSFQIPLAARSSSGIRLRGNLWLEGAGGRVIVLPQGEAGPPGQDRLDPWWTYHVHQARNAEELLAELWRPYRGLAQPRPQR